MRFTGDELKRRRLAAGLSRNDIVAEFIRAGERVSEATLIRWEAGDSQPRAEDLAMVASILGCSLDDLFDSEAA